MEQGRREEDMQQQQQSLTGIFNNHHHHRSTPPQPQLSSLFPRSRPHFDYPSASPDDSYFLDQMLSTLTSPSPSWPPPDHDIPLDNDPSPASLAAKLRLHQIATDHFIPPGSEGLPDGPHSPFKTLACLDGIGGGSIEALYNGYGDSGSGSLHGIVGSGQAAATFINQEGGLMQNTPSFGGGATAMGAGSNDGGTAGSGAAQPRQRVRARRGQATDPHSIAERLRRERIAERMKALQELVPNANKTDKASMLDEIIDYVKFLQLQVKVLSMSRLGGAASVAPLVADMSAEGVGGGAGAIDGGQHNGGNAGDGGLMVTEHQVAKLMEEDMGSAMQYLQGKGLCLMPISLATAISTVTCQSRAPKPPLHFGASVDGPSSPGLSALTVQSATTIMGNANSSAKNNGSITE